MERQRGYWKVSSGQFSNLTYFGELNFDEQTSGELRLYSYDKDFPDDFLQYLDNKSLVFHSVAPASEITCLNCQARVFKLPTITDDGKTITRTESYLKNSELSILVNKVVVNSLIEDEKVEQVKETYQTSKLLADWLDLEQACYIVDHKYPDRDVYSVPKKAIKKTISVQLNGNQFKLTFSFWWNSRFTNMPSRSHTFDVDSSVSVESKSVQSLASHFECHHCIMNLVEFCMEKANYGREIGILSNNSLQKIVGIPVEIKPRKEFWDSKKIYYKEIERSKAIEKWFNLYSTNRKAISMYLSSQINTLPIEITFFNFISSFEAIHKYFYDEKLNLRNRLESSFERHIEALRRNKHVSSLVNLDDLELLSKRIKDLRVNIAHSLSGQYTSKEFYHYSVVLKAITKKELLDQIFFNNSSDASISEAYV